METTQRPEEPAPAEGSAARGGRRGMGYEVLARMPLEELLYYVLVGDGGRLNKQ